jgi:hypothetical protein
MPDAPSHPVAARRSTAKEERWTKVLDEWKKSGLSAAAFCRERQLSESMFWFWKREIPLRRRRAARSRSPRRASVRLVPVRVVAELSRKPTPIDLIVPGGMTVRLSAGFDMPALRELLAALGIKA